MEADARIGEVLAGTYRITRLIGRGGMGSVYEAAHTRLPKRFAVKFLRAEALRLQDVFQRFRREAEIASALGHENIAEVIDFNDQGQFPYIVMELLHGEELAARIARVGQLDLSAAMTILDQATSALEAAHEQHVVHRDLKPQNIFLCRTRERDDLVKVMDFGISKIVDTASVATQTGLVLGTPSYMSPEQAEGRAAEVDARTDVFALGAIAYEMLAGRRAFEGGRPSATLYQVCQTEPAPTSVFRPDTPAAIEEVVRKALAKRREDRFATMSALRDALREASGAPAVSRQRSQPVDARPATGMELATTFGGSAAETALRRTRRRRAWTAGVVLAGVVVLAAAVALLKPDPDPKTPPTVIVPNQGSPPPPEPPREPVPDTGRADAQVIVTITVESIPASAVVLHEGKVVGKTPYWLMLPKSELPTKLQLRLTGFYSWNATVVPDKDRRLDVTLIRVPRQ